MCGRGAARSPHRDDDSSCLESAPSAYPTRRTCRYNLPMSPRLSAAGKAYVRILRGLRRFPTGAEIYTTCKAAAVVRA
jgi:hypothetical protein